MATDKEVLENTIEYASEFEREQSPFRLEVYFYQLHEADQSQNEELWNELRSVLADNSELHLKASREFLSRPSLSDEGYWWWDPEEWEVENEELGMEN